MGKTQAGKHNVHPAEFLSDSSITDYALLVDELSRVLATKKAIDIQEDILVARLQSDEFLGGIGRVQVEGGSLGVPSINCFEGVTSWIDKGRLLERGVDPDIIEYATIKKFYPRTDVLWREAGVKSLVSFTREDDKDDEDGGELEDELKKSIEQAKSKKKSKSKVTRKKV